MRSLDLNMALLYIPAEIVAGETGLHCLTDRHAVFIAGIPGIRLATWLLGVRNQERDDLVVRVLGRGAALGALGRFGLLRRLGLHRKRILAGVHDGDKIGGGKAVLIHHHRCLGLRGLGLALGASVGRGLGQNLLDLVLRFRALGVGVSHDLGLSGPCPWLLIQMTLRSVSAFVNSANEEK